MTCPPAVLAAIAQVSFTIGCLDGCGETIEVRYDAACDSIRHRHRSPACECVILPDGAAARTLGWFILEELERVVKAVVFASYGDDPVSELAEVPGG